MGPTTAEPTTAAPTTHYPTVPSGHPSASPTTPEPTNNPTTANPTTTNPTTAEPPTAKPTTLQPTTQSPTNGPTTRTTTIQPTGSPTSSGSGDGSGDSSTHHGSSSTDSCHPVEQMMPFMLVDNANNLIVNETQNVFSMSSEVEIVGILSLLTVFIICCYSFCGGKDYEKDSYEIIKDPTTVYSVI